MDGEQLDMICRSELFPDLVQRYIEGCRDTSGAAKPHDRFPNLAGFCRYCRISSSELKRISEVFPETYDLLCLAFEDEALNACMSPTVMTAYLKRRLGYGDKPETARSALDADGDGEIRVVFEQDADEDGQ